MRSGSRRSRTFDISHIFHANDNMPPERTHLACLRCRKKKRRCNGHQPCRNCSNAVQECIYDEPPKRGPSSKHLEVERSSVQETPIRPNTEKSTELNSGDIMAKRLGLRTDPSLTGARWCSWNFRLRKEPYSMRETRSLNRILSCEHMRQLTDTYFSEIQPVYKFLDRDMVDSAITDLESDEVSDRSRDSVLLGVAALACLFSEQEASLEEEIIQNARARLEYSTTLESPTVNDVVAWLLRVIFLRFTSSPNAAWIASCTLMHMIETVNLHSDPHSGLLNASSDGWYTPRLKRQIYCTARIFHTWISYEYGKPRVMPLDTSHDTPLEGWTVVDQVIWRLSDALDPNLHVESVELEDMLRQVVEIQPLHPAVQLKRCNIALCIYRRLRVTGRTISKEAIDQILRIVDDGIHHATEMAKRKLPWWHILNVPFQTICVLLAIDTKESLQRVGNSFQTLRLIAREYGTEAIDRTWDSACTLLALQSQRKREDLEMLTRIEGDLIAGEPPGVDLNLSQEFHEDLLNPGVLWDLDQILSTNICGL
ncbi:unnamed protein product [Penicillium olsonii]|uniref:Zn(2)-C6 fungal-type domain-containing protein n=1 Tax=Penicillium olsonii TaxID=99116 RepID=A0A9W4HUY6_PENOL|nr:unnamed protein product [Penicillium olsonii]CAG8168543.1 unnamed protein product [Penicillium olsonii]